MTQSASNSQTGEPDWIDAKGRKVPENLVSDVDKLKEQAVESIVNFAVDLSDQIKRFKGHTFDDVYALVDTLKEKYGATVGGPKGNIELVSYDGCRKVQISVADHIAFGPELHAAKELIDECITEWSEGSGDEIRALVQHAFATDKPGHVNREALFSLRRMKIDDPKWASAMEAITDSIRIVGSKEYARVYRRPNPKAAWEMVPLNIAAV